MSRSRGCASACSTRSPSASPPGSPPTIASEPSSVVGGRAGVVGFLIGSAGMFAVMYSTQAILPTLGRDFEVTPSEAGLTISVVVLALALSAPVWGPLSDRIGRKQSLVLASALLVLPTIGAGLAPTFEVLLLFRILQGLCMPGLLTVGVPYVAEVFSPELRGRAMGYYMSALVAGGLTGRIGVALITDVVGWRWAIGGLAILPLASSVILRRSLPDLPRPVRAEGSGLLRQVTNPRVLRAAAVGSAFFFVFVGTFSYVTYRLERPPFGYGTVASSAVFALWILGFTTPIIGRVVDRVGWKAVAGGSAALCAVGLLITLPSQIVGVVVGLAAVALGNFAGVMAAQIGVSEASKVDRGAASAVFFSFYYASGALGGYLPGLAWQSWHWNGVALVGVGVLLLAGFALVGGRSKPAVCRKGEACLALMPTRRGRGKPRPYDQG